MTDKQSKDTGDKATASAAGSKSNTTDKKATATSATENKVAEQKAPAKKASAKKAPVKKAPVKKAPAKKISAADKETADASIRSRKGADDLKARAAAAKKRAQEKILEKSFVSDPPDDPLERLANTFDNSARRWEMVVYPSLFAFVLLAGYGFFLIYRLTHDIAVLSQSVTHMAVIVSDAMPRMTKDLSVMTGSMDNMTENIDGMSTEISSMSVQMGSLTPMSKNIRSMTHNIGDMNRSVYGMQRDMHGMNRTVSSGPFGMMNDMMPFSSNSNVPRPLPPPMVWPSYNPVPAQQAYGVVPSNPQSVSTATSKPLAGRSSASDKKTGSVKSDSQHLPIAGQSGAKKKDPSLSQHKGLSMPGAKPVPLKSNTGTN